MLLTRCGCPDGWGADLRTEDCRTEGCGAESEGGKHSNFPPDPCLPDEGIERYPDRSAQLVHRGENYGVDTQHAISIQGSAEELALAQKVIEDLDKSRKIYRITYTITQMDGGKRVGAQHFALIVPAGGLTNLKQGSRVPIVTGAHETGAGKQNTEVQYQDVGLNIDSSLDGESLHSKVVQTSLAEERSSVGLQDPICGRRCWMRRRT